MNKIGIKLKTRSPAIFWRKKTMADSKKVQHSTNKKSSNIGIFDKKFTKRLLTWILRWFPQVSVSPRSFQLKSPPLVFFSSFPQKASLAWIPHWRCRRTKCKESELNTPKVSENLVRFTFPLFSGKTPQSPENIFGMSTIIFEMNIWCCEEKWDEMRK